MEKLFPDPPSYYLEAATEKGLAPPDIDKIKKHYTEYYTFGDRKSVYVAFMTNNSFVQTVRSR